MQVRFKVTYQVTIPDWSHLKGCADQLGVESKWALSAIQLMWDACGETSGSVYLLEMGTDKGEPQYYFDCEYDGTGILHHSWAWYVNPEAGDEVVLEVV